MHKSKIDKAKALQMTEKGISQADIARTLGVNRSSICRFLKRAGMTEDQVKDFRENHPKILDALQNAAAELRLDVLAEMHRRGLEELTNNELRSLYHTLFVGQGIDFDKSRLLKGQSTANYQSLIVTARKEACKKMEDEA